MSEQDTRETKREDMVGVDHDGNVTVYMHQDTRRLNYNLQPDTSPQIIRNGESYDLDTREHMDNGVSVHMCPNDSRERLEADTWSEYFDPETRTYTLPGDLLVPNSNQLEPDSRERLEADVRKHYSHTTSTLMYPPSANKQTDWLASMPMDTVFGWLDRQAAITEREVKLRELYKFEDNHRANIDATEEVNRKLNERIAELQSENKRLRDSEACIGCDAIDGQIQELTAERDQLSRDLTAEHALVRQFEDDNERLREAIDAIGNGQFYSMYKAKCEECEEAVSFAKRLENSANNGQPVTLFGVDYEKPNKKLLAEHERLTKKLKRLRRRLSKLRKERDYLQKVVKTQAESFKKLECELAGKDG